LYLSFQLKPCSEVGEVNKYSPFFLKEVERTFLREERIYSKLYALRKKKKRQTKKTTIPPTTPLKLQKKFVQFSSTPIWEPGTYSDLEIWN
jgi:hypothetical protein